MPEQEPPDSPSKASKDKLPQSTHASADWSDVQLPASFQRMQASKSSSYTVPVAKITKQQVWLNYFIRGGIILAGMLSAVLIFLYALKLILPPDLRTDVDSLTMGILPGAEPNTTILVMGVDSNGRSEGGDTYEGSRTDTMLMVRPMPAEQSLNIVSVPRDSKVYLNESLTSVGKLNGAHALGGPSKTLAVVKESLGVDVTKYIAVDFAAVRELVDALDGIDIYVSKRMRYNDNAGKLHISFNPGWHHIDGKGAEQFLRFRHDAYGDIGRIRRQQQFMAALKDRLMSSSTLFHMPDLIQVMMKYVHTNLSVTELLQLAEYVKKVPVQDMRFATLPGHTSDTRGASYWIIDKEESSQILARLIYGYGENPTSLPGDQVSESALRLGLMYHPDFGEERLLALREGLEKAGWNVMCQRRFTSAQTEVVDHSLRLSTKGIRSIQKSSTYLNKARVGFVPNTSSLAAQSCSNEAISIYVGGDVS